MPLLEDKVVLITGAASGIGQAIAYFFAKEGARIFILDINGSGAGSTASAIQTRGGFAWAVEGDVRNASDVEMVVQQAIDRFGRLDTLINNAAIYPRQPLVTMTEEQWDEILGINLKGVFQCTRLVLPHMIAQRSGKIINISSVTFHVGMKNLTHYIASKGGIIGFTRALAREVGEHNIHVNCVTPGAIETEAEKKIATPVQIDAVVSLQCLQRRILPLDVARACLFLSSELSDGMTGQTLNVDGGWAMH